MDKVGVLIISKCLSAAAIVDAVKKSEKYSPRLYVIEKQNNPFNSGAADEHVVVPDLGAQDVVAAARKFKGKAAFALTDTEDFVVGGGRDLLEEATGIPLISVSKKFAVERSKAEQRILFDKIFPGANPRFRVFDPKEFTDRSSAVSAFRGTIEGMGPVAVKPDAPARGAGVGVWGSDFHTVKDATAFFLALLERGKVVVEEKVEGEESSFHAFSDGKHFVAAPMTRDYKRGEDGNKGSLTGGMGSYRGSTERLPFVRQSDWESLASSEERAFRKWKGRGSEPGLRGIVLYDAIMHTGSGFKVLERNSRGGNTELVNIISTLQDDLIDVCYSILEGRLRGIRFRRSASVVTCVVPRSYGRSTPHIENGSRIDLSDAYELAGHNADVRILPMDVRADGESALIGSSRSVAVVGVGQSIDEARALSLKACSRIRGPLRWRTDVASPVGIRASRNHLKELRRPSA